MLNPAWESSSRAFMLESHDGRQASYSVKSRVCFRFIRRNRKPKGFWGTDSQIDQLMPLEHEGENWKKLEKRRKEKGKIGEKQGESRSGSTNSASARSVACVFHVGLASKKHKNNEDAIVAFLAGRTERGEGRGRVSRHETMEIPG
jgi:hypothetical protein